MYTFFSTTSVCLSFFRFYLIGSLSEARGVMVIVLGNGLVEQVQILDESVCVSLTC